MALSERRKCKAYYMFRQICCPLLFDTSFFLPENSGFCIAHCLNEWETRVDCSLAEALLDTINYNIFLYKTFSQTYHHVQHYDFQKRRRHLQFYHY